MGTLDRIRSVGLFKCEGTLRRLYVHSYPPTDIKVQYRSRSSELLPQIKLKKEVGGVII